MLKLKLDGRSCTYHMIDIFRVYSVTACPDTNALQYLRNGDSRTQGGGGEEYAVPRGLSESTILLQKLKSCCSGPYRCTTCTSVSMMVLCKYLCLFMRQTPSLYNVTAPVC